MDWIARAYNTVFYERADPRVKDWFLMTSPLPLASCLCAYLLMVKVLLPAYMRDRQPYDLKGFIKWYNVFQIAANAVVTWGILTSGWTTTFHLGCLLPDFSDDPMALRLLDYLWWTVILKLFEFVETFLFVLRKRERQASFLHIYHHLTSVVIIWTGVKYVGGGMTSFTPLINNSVHVVMYSYYLAAAEGGPKLRATLAKYKKYLTVIQMVQFTLMFVHASQVFLPSCPAPIGVTYIYFPNLIFVYYMFINFFRENYFKKGAINGRTVTVSKTK